MLPSYAAAANVLKRRPPWLCSAFWSKISQDVFCTKDRPERNLVFCTKDRPERVLQLVRLMLPRPCAAELRCRCQCPEAKTALIVFCILVKDLTGRVLHQRLPRTCSCVLRKRTPRTCSATGQADATKALRCRAALPLPTSCTTAELCCRWQRPALPSSPLRCRCTTLPPISTRMRNRRCAGDALSSCSAAAAALRCRAALPLPCEDTAALQLTMPCSADAALPLLQTPSLPSCAAADNALHC